MTSAWSQVSDKRKWMYHYNQCCFSSASHYIILDSAEDSFDTDPLGPTGFVVAHGGTLAYRRLRAHFQKGHPTVMLYNTGGATQARARGYAWGRGRLLTPAAAREPRRAAPLWRSLAVARASPVLTRAH